MSGRQGHTFNLYGRAAGEGFAEATVWIDAAGNEVDPSEWAERAIGRLGAKPGGDVQLSVTVWDE